MSDYHTISLRLETYTLEPDTQPCVFIRVPGFGLLASAWLLSPVVTCFCAVVISGTGFSVVTLSRNLGTDCLSSVEIWVPYRLLCVSLRRGFIFDLSA